MALGTASKVPLGRRLSPGRRATPRSGGGRVVRASISPRGVGVGLESPSRRIDQEAADSDGARRAGRQQARGARRRYEAIRRRARQCW